MNRLSFPKRSMAARPAGTLTPAVSLSLGLMLAAAPALAQPAQRPGQTPARGAPAAKPAPAKPETAAQKAEAQKAEAQKAEAQKAEAQKAEAAPASPKAGPASPPEEKDLALRFAGSPVVGEVLAGELVKAYAAGIKLPASRTVLGLDPAIYEIAAAGGEGENLLKARIDGRGTARGLRALAAGEADIWMAARQATQNDVDDAAKPTAGGKGPGLDQLVSADWEHPVALDSLVVMVNPHNPVKALTLPQLRDIFTGKVKSWSAAGGPDLPITVYAPAMGAGEYDTFCEMVMGMTNPAECEKAVAPVARKQFESGADLADEITAGAGAVGFGSAALKRGAHTIAIATECGTAEPPSGGTPKGEAWPLTRRLYFYAPPSSGTTVARFLAFVSSAAARPVIEAAGYLPARTADGGDLYAAARLASAGDARDGGRTKVRPADVDAFEEATQHAVRLPVTLHFQPGSDDLDTRARADLQRLAALMHTAPNDKAELVLIGYSQALGDYGTNHDISQRRVEAVRAALAGNFSINAAVAVGVGPAAPVACNLEPTGRFLNQRVEAWVRPGK